MALLDGWFPGTMFGASGSPDAMENDKEVSDLLMRLQMAQAGPGDSAVSVLPFAGMVQAEPPAAAQKKQTFAPSIEPSTLETGAPAGPQIPATKVGSRLPSEAVAAAEAGRTTVIPKSPAVRGGNLNAPAPARPDFGPSLGERISNFGDALTGRAYTNFDEQGRTRAATYDALLKMGMDAKMAEAAVRQPELLKAILASKLGAGRQLSLTPQWGTRKRPDGTDEWVMMQPSSTGEAAETRLPPGVSAAPPGDIAFQRRYGMERAKVAVEEPAVQARQQSAITKAKKVADEARRLARHEGLDAAVGPISSKLPTLREDTANFETDLEGMKTQVFVAAINEMRELSKTGGALGSVTEREIEKMENSIRNLSLRQGEGNMKSNLELLAKDFEDSIARIQQAYEQEYGSGKRIADPAQHYPNGSPAARGMKPGDGRIPRDARPAKDGYFYTQDPQGRTIQWP